MMFSFLYYTKCAIYPDKIMMNKYSVQLYYYLFVCFIVSIVLTLFDKVFIALLCLIYLISPKQ